MAIVTKQKLGIVISDGVGFRNFILSDFMTEAHKTFQEVIIYSCLPVHVYDPYKLTCRIVEIEPFKESFVTWFFRKAKEVAHLQKFATDNFGILDNLHSNRNKLPTVRGFATRFIFALTRFFHSEKHILQFEKWQQRTFMGHKLFAAYTSILKSDNIDVLFFTHQRPPFIAPLIKAAHSLGIKTAAFIFSWDNLASKGRMSGSFSHYLVWSHLMEEELLHFYESVTPGQISIVGTPQFEPYVLPRYQTPKDIFFQRFHLKQDCKTICFSCGDISTSKNDELYIETIASYINTYYPQGNINFIVRTSPAESPARFFALKKAYPFIVWNFPKWELSREGHQEPWSQRIPLKEDMQDLRALLEYCDVSINMCSTMSLDFMLFDKPVINPVFGNPQNGLYNDQRFLKYAHYERVAESGAVIIAQTPEALREALEESLHQPQLRDEQRKALLNIQIGAPLEGTSERLAIALERILHS
ncbi:MAG: hypothetical protein V4590_09365 [Bacteroidota bacterium]